MFQILKQLANKLKPHKCFSLIRTEGDEWFHCPICMKEVIRPIIPNLNRFYLNRRNDIILVFNIENDKYSWKRIRDGYVGFSRIPRDLKNYTPDDYDLINLITVEEEPLILKQGQYVTEKGDLVHIADAPNISRGDDIYCHGIFLTNKYSGLTDLVWYIDGRPTSNVKNARLVKRCETQVEVLSKF